jgi:hypothetical protein
VNTVEEKGLDLAFEIARACPDISFPFLEGWPLSHERREKIRRMRASTANVTWRRRVLDMRPIYQQTRVLLVPSQWDEAWGRVVVEAQFSGIPAVASDVGGLAQNVGDAGLISMPPPLSTTGLPRFVRCGAIECNTKSYLYAPVETRNPTGGMRPLTFYVSWRYPARPCFRPTSVWRRLASEQYLFWDRTLNPQRQPARPTANAAQSTSWRDNVPESVTRSLRRLIHHVTRSGDERVQRGFSPRSYRRITEDDVLRGRFSRRE